MAGNWLKDYGFNAMQLPRRDLGPADVLYRANGQFNQKVGRLSMLFSGDDQPEATPGEPVADIGRTIERKVDVSLGLKILGALFGGSQSSSLGARTEVRHAKTLTITYQDVTQDSLAVLELQSWLENATIRGAQQATTWLNNDKLAAVTAVLRTPKLSIVAERDNGAAIQLNVPEIQGVVSGQAAVSAESDTSSTVTFTGAQPIAFGFQAYVMHFKGNVSFGLGKTKALEGAGPDQDPWTGGEAIEEIREAEPSKTAE